jgi:AcrR family transcriptional regulator
LADEQKQVTRARIGRAAMVVVARRGFGATVIARESDVNPRTIFRHYTTHQNLIVATVRDMFEACSRRPIEGLPSPDDDCDGWLEGLALTIHTRNAEILGEAFWDIHARDLLGEVAVPRREARLRGFATSPPLPQEEQGPLPTIWSRRSPFTSRPSPPRP